MAIKYHPTPVEIIKLFGYTKPIAKKELELFERNNDLTRINRKSFFAFPPRFKYYKENIGGCIHVTYG